MLESRPQVVLSDVHVGRDAPAALVDDLCALLERHPGVELVFAGDIFELALEPKNTQPARAIAEILARHPRVANSLRTHLLTGGAISVLPGNHDTELMQGESRAALLSALELQDAAPLIAQPWFIRRGGVHIEHGHLYDPDNAPLHPLTQWSHATEPLGIALTRRFVSPCDVHRFAHAHKTTPLAGFLRTWRWYGARAPLVIARYFLTAGALCFEAGPRRAMEAARERDDGTARLCEFSRASALPETTLRDLLDGAPVPTHLSWQDTFMRLYFDRVITCVTGVSAGALSLAGVQAALPVAALCGSYMLYSVLRGGSRYAMGAVEKLRDGAEHVLRTTGADLVLFGHTHELDEAPGYLNLGSFAFTGSGARPYVHLDEAGAAERRFLHN